MRQYEIIRQKRRFYMFSEKTKKAVLEVNDFFDKYNMGFEDKIKKTFIYYDTPNRDLQKSNIVLFKTHIGPLCEFNMATEKISSTSYYTLRTKYKRFTHPAHPLDSPLKYKTFLIESFKSMFMSSLGFDPEFLLKKLCSAYLIETTSYEYRSTNITGLKITYSFDQDVYTNMLDKTKAKANILTIYQHSREETNADFDDLIGKLNRYCKEITPTNETKIMIARKLTHPQPVDPSKLKKKPEKKSDKKQKK